MPSSQERVNKFMQIAFNLAKKHSGLTGFNPSVGCVVVAGEKIISSAVTEVHGRPHAESIALSKEIDFKNAELFVTLEPCNHFGQTPPCVHSIIKAGIKRVFVGVKDNDKRVDGSGIDALKLAGVQVVEGILGEALEKLYAPYLFAKLNKRPFITGKIICSLDGKVATSAGNSKWISDEKAREFTNFLRHKYDGILVGGETFRKDSPQLTCRTEGLLEFSPKRFVFSNSLSEAPGFKIVKGEFADFLPTLYKEYQINHLLIEGGPTVLTKALEEGVVNELLIGHAPFFIGKDGKNCVQMDGLTEVCNAKRYKIQEAFTFGGVVFTRLTI